MPATGGEIDQEDHAAVRLSAGRSERINVRGVQTSSSGGNDHGPDRDVETERDRVTGTNVARTGHAACGSMVWESGTS
jgi:hypothetical protein